MSGTRNISDRFHADPDIASKAKSIFVSYYMSLYFKIIKGTVSKINYLDFFSGRGKFDDGTYSVPLNVLNASKDIGNISYFFNDKNEIDVLKKNIKDSDFGNILDKCTFSKCDCSKDNMKKFIPDDGAILAYVDSFSHLLSNTKFISSLIEPDYSDCVLFINFQNIIRHYNQENEKNHFIEFFGSEEHFKEMKIRVLDKRDIKWDKKVYELLRDYIVRLSKEVAKPIYCLPVFFKVSDEASNTSHVILIISKNKTGIERIRESFSPKDFNNLDDSLKNSYFNIRNGSFVVFEENIFQKKLFDFNEDYFKSVLNYLGVGLENAITRDSLYDFINNEFYNKHKYCSAISKKYLNKALKYLEKEKLIKVTNTGARKRVEGTFGNNVLIYKEG